MLVLVSMKSDLREKKEQRPSLVFLKKKPNSRVYSSSSKRAGSFKCETSYLFELLNNTEEYGHRIGCTGFIGNDGLAFCSSTKGT